MPAGCKCSGPTHRIGSSPLREESVEVCVIGSGAGGSLIAYEAARRGLSVLVLESGPEVRADQMSGDELRMIPWLYKDGGLQMNASHDLFILQGTCVGGSTLLSNMVLLRADDDVIESWRALGLKLTREQLHAAYTAVETELGAAIPDDSTVSESARLFLRGSKQTGFDAQWMRKAIGDCRGCGLCNVGCVFDTKRSALTTYLDWARREGARVLAQTEVTKLEGKRGHIKSVIASTGRSGERLRVRARLFVVAAGAIGSSALLLDSGITSNVGTRLSMNAGSMVVAEFAETLDSFDADQMSVYLRTPEFCIECTHNPLMSAALTTPGWFEDHGRLMARSRHLAYAGGMVGTEPVGRVVQSRIFGHEEVHFSLLESDLRKLRDSLRTIAEVFFAAGAVRVILPTHRFVELKSTADLPLIDANVHSQRDLCVGSAHPQGGNPLAEDPRLGAVTPELFVHGYDNLAVCDASVFPSSMRVNPIDTILALGRSAAPGILAHA
jgi:choline dehydrogenase-like flavoprotein